MPKRIEGAAEKRDEIVAKERQRHDKLVAELKRERDSFVPKLDAQNLLFTNSDF